MGHRQGGTRSEGDRDPGQRQRPALGQAGQADHRPDWKGGDVGGGEQDREDSWQDASLRGETVVIEAVKEQVIKSDGGLEKDLTEGAGDHVLEDVAVEMNEEKMEQHIAEIFSRPDTRKEETGAPANAASMSLENSQILSRPPRDNSVKDVTALAAKDAVAVEEEVKERQQEDQDDHQEEKIPQKNGSSKH